MHKRTRKLLSDKPNSMLKRWGMDEPQFEVLTPFNTNPQSGENIVPRNLNAVDLCPYWFEIQKVILYLLLVMTELGRTEMKILIIVALIFGCAIAKAEIITPNAGVTDKCGPKIKTKQVMVLDLEPFGEDEAAAKAFVLEHAGKHEIYSSAPEIIETKSRGAMYDRESGIKRAAKEAAKRGCDLVLVLRAATQVVGGVSFGYGNANTYGSNTYGNAVGSSSGVKTAAAMVVMGDRIKQRLVLRV